MGIPEILSVVIAVGVVGGIAMFGPSWVRRAKGGTPESDTPDNGKK